MRRLFYFVKGIISLFLINISLCSCFADIQKIESIKQIQTELENASKDTLIAFDVDDTLTIHKDVILRRNNRDLLKKLFTDHNIKDEDVHAIFFTIISQSRDQLVEPEFASMIDSLVKKGKKVIAWTRRSGGNSPGNVIPKLEYFSFYLLKSLGLDFRNSFPQAEEIYIKRGAHGRIFYCT